MVIYAIPGESTENISYIEPFVLPDSYVIMSGPRPDPTYYADENGEWLPGPAPQIVQQMLIEATQKQKDMLSHASDMIGAITDEIEGLEDAEEDVPDKLRADLKAWKQYRVVVKNVDVSLAPDIEWPVAPE
ncbi:TPA: tail fiber assembly protein [Yersinia enterocolitica]|uniref:tail fiber assembly protein n=1 Tax=Yersinia enterocolitica TaxID=630 RepID=UPI00289082F9|nr:tail fiber assembly protein [Yersinia enterocolitica]ELW8194214.1 tail fiber assembly protein [Yersinia enterocolitica]HDL7326833.1 tail fiber assembly protein [Yersinia enterocolitica]HDL7352312.1 tail fiber assembly protein [Yersinia enterocolitica]HDX8417829.1 tail fiber assembly protein [Yersinia enterocolitica]